MGLPLVSTTFCAVGPVTGVTVGRGVSGTIHSLLLCDRLVLGDFSFNCLIICNLYNNGLVPDLFCYVCSSDHRAILRDDFFYRTYNCEYICVPMPETTSTARLSHYNSNPHPIGNIFPQEIFPDRYKLCLDATVLLHILAV